jgi:hypothetical protein
MSATTPLPTVGDFLEAHADAIRIELGPEQNTRRGSVLDLTAGPTAMIWAAEAARDRALFRQVYTDTASGAQLDSRVLRRYGVSRVHASRGAGQAVLARASAITGGTLFEGTRIEVRRALDAESVIYAVAADTAVIAGEALVTVPIRAARPGSGTRITSAQYAALADATFDVFTVQSIWCADGTDEEAPTDYIARARAAKRAERPGYRRRIEDVCRAAGAAYIVLLDAGEFGDAADFGVTHVYVADAGYSSPAALVDACSDAVDAVHIEGNDVQVLPMVPTPVQLDLVVALWQDPGQFDLAGLRQAITATVLAMFNARPRFHLFDHDSIRGEVHRAGGDAVQSVSVITDPAPPTPGFVAELPRYMLAAAGVTVAFTGPT